MDLNHNHKNLSHIILYADKNLPQDMIWAFCTNIKSENPGIKTTYLCYDNQSPGGKDDEKTVLNKYTAMLSGDTGSVFFISDSEYAVLRMKDLNIASAALLTENNRNRGFDGILYCIEEIEYMTFSATEKMWKRFHDIPWTIIQTERLIIREQTLEDLDDLYEIYSDREISKYTEDLYEDRRKEADYLRKYIDNQYRFYEYGVWALTLRDSGTLIGRAGISRREGFDIPEIGYIIGKRYQRQGYAKEAVEAVMKYGREELGFDEYMAFTRTGNVPSVRLLESMGFACTGHMEIAGHDHAMYTVKFEAPAFDQSAIK